MKQKIKEIIVVEGRYDQNTLAQVVDAVIIPIGGFSLFNDREKLGFLRRLAEKQGLIVLTDSDGAGFVLRNYLKGALPKEQVKHAYIPDVYGKERRKRTAGKEGKLGVEGMKPEVLLEALRHAGATFMDGAAAETRGTPLSKADFFAMGFSGTADSAARRQALLRKLNLPKHLTANGLLEAVNLLYSREDFEQFVERGGLN